METSMKLRQLLQDITILDMNADLEMEISGVCYDSREAKPGDLFVAVRGFEADGHRFIPGAVKKGAVAVLCETPGDGCPVGADG